MRATQTRQKKFAPGPRTFPAGLWAVFIGVIGLLVAFGGVVLWKDESSVAALTGRGELPRGHPERVLRLPTGPADGR